MLRQQLFLFDFDGVVVDGMNEYWQSSLLAYEKFLKSPETSIEPIFYKQVSKTFVEIRPWVKYGWEMILIVHEIVNNKEILNENFIKNFTDRYEMNCQKILKDNCWNTENLQKCLDESRKYQIAKDFDIWVNLHDPFYEVLEFIKKLKDFGIKSAIITTKGEIFASRILEKLNIIPEFIFGYESGTKIEIAKMLSSKYQILGFIEDRKKTLLDIKQNNETEHIACYLADWGYLKQSDRLNLPNGIKLVELKKLSELLAI